MEFKVAKFDTPALITTSIVTFLLAGLATLVFFLAPHGWVFSIISVLIISLSYLLSPMRYSFKGSDLIIRKVIGKEISIKLSEVESYVVVPNFTKLRVARTFGNGGLFGYYGTFSTAEYGPIDCQLRSLKNVIILKTKDKTYAISPDAVAQFEEKLTNAVKGVKGTIDVLVPSEPGTMEHANPLILLLPVFLFILTVVMVLLVYLQLPERVAVHFDMHGNPDGWGSRTSYLISGILPAAVLAAISILTFFIVRRAARKPNLPYLLVIIFAVIQFFTAYISFETYWVNKQGNHIIPFPYNMIVYFIAIAVLLFVYYRKVRSSA
ncbi:MAG: PH domain-containing protein [candidate division WOR-3 bacterium]|nr:PH domain-containing protein [candidate division WOR-3 bacterium]